MQGSAETCRRISCDAVLVTMTHAPEGGVLDVGRRRRTVRPAIRRALVEGTRVDMASTLTDCSQEATFVHDRGPKD